MSVACSIVSYLGDHGGNYTSFVNDSALSSPTTLAPQKFLMNPDQPAMLFGQENLVGNGKHAHICCEFVKELKE